MSDFQMYWLLISLCSFLGISIYLRYDGCPMEYWEMPTWLLTLLISAFPIILLVAIPPLTKERSFPWQKH